ncbi:hypothetical protein H310_12740 [Aphanomyces invadans]|uniref:Uncharacterized protein n=1 Tax=Aphanomyces invadans TaxID=157072 RepID=A0A024TGF1_9STRA|nr:hypothetical protein H310_12740 [Aphanomyces invadans]ETV93128.1 hypothetical protein H310_12740 [Aphanomyces invadans]|eukprot:XP_008878150.1 hypothetical protein H310_12740 [Aphanomyces invadans]
MSLDYTDLFQGLGSVVQRYHVGGAMDAPWFVSPSSWGHVSTTSRPRIRTLTFMAAGASGACPQRMGSTRPSVGTTPTEPECSSWSLDWFDAGRRHRLAKQRMGTRLLQPRHSRPAAASTDVTSEDVRFEPVCRYISHRSPNVPSKFPTLTLQLSHICPRRAMTRSHSLPRWRCHRECSGPCSRARWHARIPTNGGGGGLERIDCITLCRNVTAPPLWTQLARDTAGWTADLCSTDAGPVQSSARLRQGTPALQPERLPSQSVDTM